MTISSIRFRYLSHLEFIQFINHLLVLADEADPALVHLQEECDKMALIVEEMNQSFKYWRAMPETAHIHNADKRRIAAYTGIRMNVKSFLFHHDTNLRAAAALLFKNISKYGTRLALLNYPSKTVILDAIVKEWATKPKLNAAMITLQLQHWHAEMKSANELFETLHMERIQLMAAKGNVSTKQKREEAMVLYTHMRQLTAAYYTINKKDEQLKSFINSWNVLVNQYNVLITGKGKKNPAIS